MTWHTSLYLYNFIYAYLVTQFGFFNALLIQQNHVITSLLIWAEGQINKNVHLFVQVLLYTLGYSSTVIYTGLFKYCLYTWDYSSTIIHTISMLIKRMHIIFRIIILQQILMEFFYSHSRQYCDLVLFVLHHLILISFFIVTPPSILWSCLARPSLVLTSSINWLRPLYIEMLVSDCCS